MNRRDRAHVPAVGGREENGHGARGLSGDG